MKCKRCQTEANHQVLTPEGPHYGKVVCALCGTWLAWLPRPAAPLNMAKLPKVEPGYQLPPLTGVSQKQIDFGVRCRANMLGRLQTSLVKEVYEAMQTIKDSTFWIANNDKPAAQIRWPQEWS
jgi:hypothetical protein